MCIKENNDKMKTMKIRILIIIGFLICTYPIVSAQIEMEVLPQADSATHLVYKQGKPFDGIDSVGPLYGYPDSVKVYMDFYGKLYYKKGKLTKVEEIYLNSPKMRRAEFDFDSNQAIKDGNYIIWYQDSSFTESECLNGSEVMEADFDKNKKIQTLTNLKEGHWTTRYCFYDNGMVRIRESFTKNNSYHDRYTKWHKNGKIKFDLKYADSNKYDGPFRHWYNDGRIKVEGQNINGKLEGNLCSYSEIDKTKKVATFKDDSVIDMKYYGEDGKVMTPINYNKEEIKKAIQGKWVDCIDSNIVLTITKDSIFCKFNSSNEPPFDGMPTFFKYLLIDTCCPRYYHHNPTVKYYIHSLFDYHSDLIDYSILFINKNYLDLYLIPLRPVDYTFHYFKRVK
jgi:antitoxin component YwqK of YwqJK toxin-antitoxin module